MHTAEASRLAFNPDIGVETSFPERHFMPYDAESEPTVFPPSDSSRLQSAVTKRQIIESNLASLCSRDWGGQAYPHENHAALPLASLLDHSHSVSVSVPPTAPPLPSDWARSCERPAAGFFWQPTHTEWNLEDDSDSNQSPNDSPDEIVTPLPAWTSTQRPRRRSTYRVTKPTRAPASTLLSHRVDALSDGHRTAEADSSLVWFDRSDLAAAFLPQATGATDDTLATRGAKIDVSLPDGSSSSSKVDSKRIAHKLSEKTRRNRLTIAIREIQKLLPSEGEVEDRPESQSGKEADFVVRPGIPSSKLDVVEMAVGFIKDLKKRNMELKRGLREAERRLEHCRCLRGRAEAAACPAAEQVGEPCRQLSPESVSK